MMVLAIVFAKHVLVAVYLILWHVALFFTRLNLLTQLSADVAKVMRATVMYV